MVASTSIVMLLDQIANLIRFHWIASGDRRLVLDLHALWPSTLQWIGSMFLALPLAFGALLLNRLESSRKVADRLLAQDLAGSSFGELAVRSLDTGLPMALTLDTGHVVIGHPLGLQSFAAVSSDVDILPFVSGYRSEMHDLVLTTSYHWIYGLPESEQQSFVKAIHRDRIVSANLFDQERFLQFSSQPRSLP